MEALRFTRRMREISWCLLAGMSNREASDALFISLSTFKGHVSKISAQLDLEPPAVRQQIILALLGVDVALIRSDKIEPPRPMT